MKFFFFFFDKWINVFYTPLIVAHFGGHLDVFLFFAFALILVFANVSILFAHTGPG